MWELILNNLGPIVGFIVSAIAGLAIKKKWINEDLGRSLELDVNTAVTSTYFEYVKSRKASAEDGKLTELEKKEARSMALNKLGQIGKSKGVDYLKKYGVPVISSLVEKYVSKNKK